MAPFRCKAAPRGPGILEKTMDSGGDATIAGVPTEPCEDITVASVSVRMEELDLEVAFRLGKMTMPIARSDGDAGGRTRTLNIYVES